MLFHKQSIYRYTHVFWIRIVKAYRFYKIQSGLFNVRITRMYIYMDCFNLKKQNIKNDLCDLIIL